MSSQPLTEVDDDPEILVDLHDGIGRITFNRPDQRNPMTVTWISGFAEALDTLGEDPECRVIIITGNGPVFCGGADLKNLLKPEGVDMEEQLLVVRKAFRLATHMHELDVPLIAAVNGPAVGGGCAIGMACDIAIAAPSASYYFAFGRIGASGADVGCTYLLPRRIGATRAAHLLLTGATVEAQQGFDLGLFVELVESEELLSRAESIARQIIEAYPRRAAAITKMALIRGESSDLATCLEYEALAQNYTFRTKEHEERLGKFLQGWK